MGDVLVRIPGLLKVPGSRGTATYLASARAGATDGGPVFLSKQGPGVYCYVTVFVDGVKLFQARSASEDAQNPQRNSFPMQPFNFDGLRVSDFAAAEYYSGAASIPAEYNATGSSCGVLLLWTRER